MEARLEVAEEIPPVKSADEEVLAHIANQARQMPLAVLGVLMLIASLIYPYSAHGEWAIWLGAVVLVLVLRFLVLTRLPEADHVALPTRMNIAALMSGVNGLVHGASLFYFPYMTDIERAIQCMVLVGLCTASVGTTAGNARVFFAYFIPVLTPMPLLWTFSGTESTTVGTLLGLAAAITIFGVVLILLRRDNHRQFVESVHIRQQQQLTNKQLQKALHDAEVADRAKTRFLASASHDLRQPIHALALFSAALRMQPLSDKVQHLADNIDESVSTLAAQLDALLDISRLDAGVVEPDIELCDLTTMLERVVREFEVPAAEKGLRLEKDLVDSCIVNTDKLLLERVVRNLLGNAMRYTDTGTISVELRKSGEGCQLSITDTGIGIAEQDHGRVFSEFYQVSRGVSAAKQGLGLGLSIVSRLLSLLGAPVEMSSTPGEGTRFVITLNVSEGDLVPGQEHKQMSLEGIRILIIDDNSMITSAMCALLESFGAATDGVLTIESALAAARANKPDMVISDLRLEQGDGIEAVRELRCIYQDLPGLLITGDTGREQIRLAHDSGLEILHKPVSALELERKISEIVR